jgi:EF-P beta-lysylation protein EpmB
MQTEVTTLARIATEPAAAEAAAGDDSAGWQAELRRAVRSVAELARLLELPVDALGAPPGAERGFPLLVPRGFVARMRKGDPGDPLLLQVLPRAAETRDVPGFSADPLAERGLARNGSLRKYAGRALLITTGACPVHCRYCFRRAFPYSEQTAAREDWRPALAEIARSPGVREIILSGGDPLTLSNARLARLVAAIETLGTIETLRIHTRFPIVLPERVDSGLLALLERTRLNTVVVLHANHAAELDAAVARAAALLKPRVSLLLNQSVLLKGVNDDALTLHALGERLLECGIAPYYLHLLDRVEGTAHFEVGADAARALVAALRARAPGYLVPALVREEPGALSKMPVL